MKSAAAGGDEAAEVHIVTWGGHVHAVCESREQADGYVAGLPKEAIDGARIEAWRLGTGWSPEAEARTPIIPG